jgi:hypothetical protein
MLANSNRQERFSPDPGGGFWVHLRFSCELHFQSVPGKFCPQKEDGVTLACFKKQSTKFNKKFKKEG